MKPSNNMENKTPSDTHLRVQLVREKVQNQSPLEGSLEYNQDQMPLTNQGLLWPFQQSWELQKYYAVSDYF